MAVSFVATASAGNGATSNSSSAVFTIPATAAIGDTAVVVLLQNTGVNTFTGPGGWTQLRTDYVASTIGASVFIKDLVSGDPGSSATFTASGSSHYPGVMSVYRGTSAANAAIVAPATNSTTGNTVTSPAITTTADNSYVLALWTYRTNTAAPATTLTMPGTHTLDGSAVTAFTASPNNAVYVSHLTTPGLTGTYAAVTATAGASSVTTSITYTVSLAPTAVAFTGSIALSGSGAIASSGTPAVSGARANTGASSLAGSGTPAITGSLSLGGAGSLVLAGGAPIAGSLSSTGDGQLTLAGLAVRYVFTPPNVQRYVPVIPPVNALMNFGLAVLHIGGQWVETEYPTEEQLNTADLYFPGGYDNPVDANTAALLTAAGYAVTQIQES